MGWLLAHSFLLSALLGLFGRGDAMRPMRLDFNLPTAKVPGPAEAPPVPPAPAPVMPQPPRKKDPDSLGVTLTAKSSALVDTKSGALLFSTGDDAIAPIASITKLMTAMGAMASSPV